MLARALGNIINYEIKLYARKGGEVVTIAAFFLIALTLFPFALGADNPHMTEFAPALIWVVALLASLLSLPVILHRDMADGSLDQLRLSGVTLEWVVFAKCLANWIGCQLPLIFISPLIGMMLGMGEEQGARLMSSLLIGTPVLCAIGTLGAALTMHAANMSGVLAVVILPLYIPVLIFATSLAMSSPQVPIFSLEATQLLGGIFCAVFPLGCWAAAWIIRLQD